MIACLRLALDGLTPPLRASAIAMGVETIWSANDWASAIVLAIEERLLALPISEREAERKRLVAIAESMTLVQLRAVGAIASAMGDAGLIITSISTFLDEQRRSQL